MGFATHLGPWLLGTVKDTTGTTAGTIRNTGVTVVSQSGTVGVANTTAINLVVLPAGAQITSIFCDVTTAFAGTTGNTITVQTAGGTSLVTFGSATTTPLALGRNATVFTSSAGAVAAMLNVGATDLILQVIYACAGTASGGAATITVNYAVRNPDGSAFPAYTAV
jgi:hypothetical protein